VSEWGREDGESRRPATSPHPLFSPLPSLLLTSACNASVPGNRPLCPSTHAFRPMGRSRGGRSASATATTLPARAAARAARTGSLPSPPCSNRTTADVPPAAASTATPATGPKTDIRARRTSLAGRQVTGRPVTTRAAEEAEEVEGGPVPSAAPAASAAARMWTHRPALTASPSMAMDRGTNSESSAAGVAGPPARRLAGRGGAVSAAVPAAAAAFWPRFAAAGGGALMSALPGLAVWRRGGVAADRPVRRRGGGSAVMVEGVSVWEREGCV